MKRILLFLPLLAAAPALVAVYFQYLASPPVSPPAEILSTPDANLKAARAANGRASKLFSQARAGTGQEKELLQQAIIQYRICLAYENAHTRGWSAVRGRPPESRSKPIASGAAQPSIHPDSDSKHGHSDRAK